MTQPIRPGSGPSRSTSLASPMPSPAKSGRYHHGDLKAALVDAAVALIAERGLRGFSLAEATPPGRRVRGRALPALRRPRRPAGRGRGARAPHVRGHGGRRGLARHARSSSWPRWPAPTSGSPRSSGRCSTRSSTQVIDKSRYPELTRAWAPIDALLDLVNEICAGDEPTADALAAALEATAHGHAALLRDGEYGDGPDAVRIAADRAAAATLALIAGRQALR